MPPGTWDERRLRIATDAAGVALWAWNVDTDQIVMDERAFALWDLPLKEKITFEELSACIHPADKDMVREAFSATRDLSGAYETDFRILHNDDVRWVSARGRGDDQGIVGRTMFGVFLDVTVRKLAEEARDLITGEMQHRIKNLFSLASALTNISQRSTSTTKEMADDLHGRLLALSAAHDLIYRGFHGESRSIILSDLIKLLLGAYFESHNNYNIKLVDLPGIRIGEQAVPSLALIIHELATNAVKHGALSTVEGKLELACVELEKDIEFVWTETGCQMLDNDNKQEGFGSILTEKVITHIGGSIDRKWTDFGLVVTFRMSKQRLAA